jgi:hypothetical protein
LQSLSIETSTLYLHTPSWQWDSGTTRQTGLLTMNNPHSACRRNTLMRECGIFGGIFVCDCKSGPGQQIILIFGHTSPHCRSRDHPLDFPTTSWHLSRLVALITPHEFGEVSSSAIFDLELGIRSIRASAAEVFIPSPGVFQSNRSSSCAVVCFVAHIGHGNCPAQGFILCLILLRIRWTSPT